MIGERDMTVQAFGRFASRVRVADDNCWRWTGSLNHHGYGQFSFGRTWGAHRLAYLWFVGPIPPGYEIDHLCREHSCVNPAHLEAVHPKENNRRRWNPTVGVAA